MVGDEVCRDNEPSDCARGGDDRGFLSAGGVAAQVDTNCIPAASVQRVSSVFARRQVAIYQYRKRFCSLIGKTED